MHILLIRIFLKKGECNMKPFYRFQTPLTQGVIIDHPNRFLMHVKVGRKTYLAHSPTTGKIGLVKLDGCPALLSKASDPNRKTQYTVEAISYDRSDNPNREWIGINQGASNRYVGYFIALGAMKDMIKKPKDLQPEHTYGRSRFDFLSDEIYIEVKTPIRIIEKKLPEGLRIMEPSNAFGGERLVKHMNELADMVETTGHRAIILTCFQYLRDPDSKYHYDNDAGKLVNYVDAPQIVDAFNRAKKVGVESWTVEMSISPDGVALERYQKET